MSSSGEGRVRVAVVLFVAALQWASAASASELAACPRADQPIPAGIEISVPEGAKPRVDASVVIRNACKGGTLRRGYGALSHVASAEFLPTFPNLHSQAWRVCGSGRFASRSIPPRICTKSCDRGCLYFGDVGGGLMGMSADPGAESSCTEEQCHWLVRGPRP